MQRPGAPGGTSGASLGVVPDYSNGVDQASKGVRITGTVPFSPAAVAGLKDGDIIVQFNKDPVDTLYDLADELGKSRPGDQVTVSVMRGNQRLELHAKLTTRSPD